MHQYIIIIFERRSRTLDFAENHEYRWKNISLSDSTCSRGFSRWKFIIPPGHKSPFYDEMHQTATLRVSPIVFILSEFTKAYPIIPSGWHFIHFIIITEDAIFALLHFLLPPEHTPLISSYNSIQNIHSTEKY